MKTFKFIALASLLLALTGCKKDTVEYQTSYAIDYGQSTVEGTHGTSDFHNISDVVDPYLGKTYLTENEVLAVYNDILSKTRNAEYTAPKDSYYKLYTRKSIANQSNTGFIDDPAYKSPAHIWDKDGSRDL